MNSEKNIALRAWVYTKRQMMSALASEYTEAVYVPMFLADGVPEKYADKTIILPPEILSDCEEKTEMKLSELRRRGFKRAAAHTVGHIELLKSAGAEICGTNRLNCTNSESLGFFAEQGIGDIILSAELTAEKIKRLKVPHTVKTGIIAYGHIPLMLNRRCPVCDGKPCGKYISGGCGKKLSDRKGGKLDVICSENSVEILNSDTLWLSDKLGEFAVDFAVLRFTVESDIDNIIEAYASRKAPLEGKFTRGLYFRGVL